MDVTTSDKKDSVSGADAIPLKDPEEFFPRGAIAFFVSLIVGFAAIWAGVYLLMLHRQFHL